MTTFTTEQFITANKTAAAEFGELATTAFAGFEKFAELNLAAGKSALVESLDTVQAILGAKTPQDALAVQTALVQPLAEKAAAYTRTMYEIASETGAELTKAAEGKFAEGQKTFASAIDSLVKNAPSGSESAVAAFKSALATGQQMIESVQASAKQAVAQAEKNVAAATDVAVKAAKKK